MKLADALDDYIPTPERPVDERVPDAEWRTCSPSLVAARW